MGWTIEYWDGAAWTGKPDAILVKLSEELNGHEELTFRLPNTSGNRTFVETDKRVRVKFNATVLWTGMLYAPVYGEDIIDCVCYNECYERMKAKDFTGEYINTAANTILSAICSAAGVTAGECPTTVISVRFKRALCLDAAVFLSDVTNKDFWSDYDAAGTPRFNIGDKRGGTVLELPMDEGSGNIVYDQSGKDNNGTLYPTPLEISLCESYTNWTGTSLALDTDRVEGSYAVKDTVATPAAGTNYTTAYNPAGSWNISAKKHLIFWLKCDRPNTAFTSTRVYIYDTAGNWGYWNLTFSAGEWARHKKLLTAYDGQSVTAPDLTVIDRITWEFVAADTVAFYRLYDAVFVDDRPEWVEGKYGAALSFDGVDDHITVPDSPSLDLTRFTVMFWVKVNVLKDFNAFVVKGNDVAENFEMLGKANGAVHMSILWTDGTRTSEADMPPNTLVAGEWIHLAQTYKPGEWRGYKNGKIITEITTVTKTPAVNDVVLRIAHEDVGRFLDGIIEEIRIFNRALSPEEIKSIYEPGVIAYPSRGIDRSKRRDRVIIRGVDADGNEIEGSAGTGAKVATFTEKKATTVDTLNALAERRLADLNKESSGVKLPVKITDAYNLYPGYSVVLNKPSLALVGPYRIWRTVKKIELSEIEVDRQEVLTERYLEKMKQYEELGIYPLAMGQTPVQQAYSFIICRVGIKYFSYRQGLVKYQGKFASTVINNTIADADCSSILFTKGLYECSGTITLKNYLTIHVDEGAEIRATAALDRLLDGRGKHHITIEGKGTINGDVDATKVVDLSWTSGYCTDNVLRDIRVTGGRDVANSCLLDLTYNSEVDTENIVLDGYDTSPPQFCILLDKSDGQNTLKIKRLSRFKVAAVRQGGGELKIFGGAIVTPHDSATACFIMKPNGQVVDTKFFGVWFEGVSFPNQVNVPVVVIQEGPGEARHLMFDNCYCLADNKAVVKSETTTNHLKTLTIIGGTLSSAGPWIVDCFVTQTVLIKPQFWTIRQINTSKFLGSYELGMGGGTQNLCRNPSYEFGDWGGPETQSSEQARFGVYSAKLVATGSTITSSMSDFMYVKGCKRLTVAAWLKITSLTAGVLVACYDCYDAAKAWLACRVIATLNAVTDWRQVMRTLIENTDDLPAGTVFIRLRFYWDSTPTGVGFADGWQVVYGDSLPQFEDYSFPLSAIGDSAPPAKMIGDIWFDTSANQLKRWDGTAWKVIHHLSGHGTAFPAATVGDFFFRTDLNSLFRYDGTSWKEVLRTMQWGTTFPTARFVGDTFYHSGYEQTFYWDGSAWRPLVTIARQGTAFPTDKVSGDLFYRTDQEQFFRYDGTKWVRLDFFTSASVTLEDLLINNSFEEDRDANGIPDGWRVSSQKGDGAATLDTTDSKIGGKSLKLSASAGTANGVAVGIIQRLIVEGGRKYFASYWAKGSGINPILALDWYDRTGTYISTNTLTGSISATWAEYKGEFISPSTARYLVCYFQVWEPAAATTIFHDAVRISELRAAAPTAEIVAAAGGHSGAGFAIVPGAWMDTGASVVVPADDHELLICHICHNIYSTVADAGFGIRLYTAVKDETTGVWYPSSTNTLCPFNAVRGVKDIGGTTEIGVNCMIAIPRNVKGHTLKVFVYPIDEQGSAGMWTRFNVWGHTPHMHR